MKKLTIALICLFIFYWLPFLIISAASQPQDRIELLPSSDAVIVFGTLVRNAKVSPLLKERLDASIAIYTALKVKAIVVSNMGHATTIMQQYLIAHGIPANHIDLDVSAKKHLTHADMRKRNTQNKES